MFIITNIYFITAIAVLGGALFGFDISSMSAIIGTDTYINYFGPDISSNVQGGITAAMPGGSFIGAIVSGFISDKLGRKYAIQVGAVFWIVGSIIICAAQNIGMLVAGRFINGIAVGICSAQVPVYITEISRADIRGRLVGFMQWSITWGIMIMFYISFGCSYIEGVASFRIPWGLQMIPAIGLFFGLFVLPESPRWLARNGRWEECENILALMHANGDRTNHYVQSEMKDIRELVEFEAENADASFIEIFKPNMLMRTHIGIFTQIWSQLTGMNVMMYYITYVFAMAGLTGDNLLVSSSIQYIINVVMTIPALIFIDRWGRRYTFMIGSVLMMTWLFANAGLMATYGEAAPPGGINGQAAASWIIHGPASKAVIACSYLFVASFAITWGPCSWVYPAEIFPLRIRGKAVSVATCANWIFNFALGYFVPPAFENIKWKVYVLFGVFCLAMTIHVFFLFPETAGKTIEEIEEMFQSKVPAWRTKVVKGRDGRIERPFSAEEKPQGEHSDVEKASA